jgi:signal peptidase I
MFFKPAYIKDAQERRRLLNKVYFYRRSQLSDSQLQELKNFSQRFAKAIAARENQQTVEKLQAQSDQLLARVGVHYFKNYHLFENVETFVVAAILAIGIRSFFLQPFKIPTNSMWPTYHGMTYEVLDNHRMNSMANVAPLEKLQPAFQFIFQGSTRYRLIAPVDGELKIPVFSPEERDMYHAAFRYAPVTRMFLGLIPTRVHEYTFYIGETPAIIDVPDEFSYMDKLLVDKFFANLNGAPLEVDGEGRALTGVTARAGESLLNFKIETGDMLFVDRFTYNFIPPKVGAPIVFRTRGVPGLTLMNGGAPDDKYYIKRLVGLPGDKLSILETTLYRNGQPITGSDIFAKNSRKTPPYPGYQANYDLAGGQAVKVPDGMFYAFGDNSPDSLDSRAWGGLPQNQLVGKAVFIYYPFTARWGFSR